MSGASADLLLHNARVLTMDQTRPEASLVAVQGDRIAWVGQGDADHFRGPSTTVIDCEGRTVIPGFIDAHIHLFAYAASLISLDCSPSAVSSIADIQRAIRRRAGKTPRGAWVRAWGFEEFDLQEKRAPTRWELDAAAPEHPLKLVHRSGHASVLNSLGLARLGITSETPEPLGGEIARELETGELTGYLLEMEAELEARGAPTITELELGNGLDMAFRRLLSLGVTSVHEATPTRAIEHWELLDRLRNGRALPLRVSKMVAPGDLSEVQRRGLSFGAGDSWLRLGAVKVMLNETGGDVLPPQEALREQVLEAHRAGFQVAFHAVEETGVRAAIDAVGHALRRSPGQDLRHRIEHCGVCLPELMGRMAALSMGVVTQPAFVRLHGDRYREEVPAGLQAHLYPTASLIDGGVPVAFGSDCPVAPPDPRIGLSAATTRSTLRGWRLGPGEAVSAATALELYTAAGARMAFEEERKGKISSGFLADLILLSGDPTALPAGEIETLRVDKTIVGGRVAWER